MLLSQRFSHKSGRRVARVLLLTQILSPLMSAVPLSVRADPISDNQGTVSGLDSLLSGQTSGESNRLLPKTSGTTLVPSSGTETHVSAPRPSFIFRDTPESASGVVSSLPSLSSPTVHGASDNEKSTDADQKATQDEDLSSSLAGQAAQAGSLLSGPNATESSINYARGLGEGLINQQINDWLNQFGNARVSVDSRKHVSGDMLIPLYESEDNLFYTQAGARTDRDRNTLNAGVGYRQYLDTWMLGANSFYDYDLTGHNRRLGIGGEAWRDNLKLAVNGYFRLTDWHQSALSTMEDYDERPANGFDVRAEGYLPAWPSLGGSIKYEHYFGKGVSVSDNTSPDHLKDNPSVVTVGVNYTPVPLITLNASRATGDSNDTRVGIDMNYRLGVPLSSQLSPDSVGLARTLAGSRYDLVDRNYNIVMQYRKQDLLNIGLPERQTVQAAETITVPLTVSHAKYGLKSTNWTVSPDLIAHGGHYKVLSPTEIQIVAPAYIFSTRSTAAQEYQISAVAQDNHGNESNTATMTLGVLPSENIIGALTITPSGQTLPADNKTDYTVTATVTNKAGARLAGQKITFNASALPDAQGRPGLTLHPKDDGQSNSEEVSAVTQANGQASVLLHSRVAGTAGITATMENGNQRKVQAAFTGDAATATVSDLRLNGKETSKVADGKNQFTYTAHVRDAGGNPIAGMTIQPTVDKADVTVAANGQTAKDGAVTLTLTSTHVSVSDITVSAQAGSTAAVNADRRVSFTSGTPAQQTSLISTDQASYLTGTDMAVTVALKDAYGNAITGNASALTTGTVKVQNATLKTGSSWKDNGDGTYTATYTAITAGTDLTATLKLSGWSGTAMSATYVITANIPAQQTSLISTDKTSYVSGTDMAVKVSLKDATGNAIVGQAALLLTSVQVQNATLKTGSKWLDNGDGTYTATYTAKTIGTGLEATLKLTGWNGAATSADYVITVGTPVSQTSLISTNETSYLSGTDMVVKVTLKDVSGNVVTGQAAQLATGAVKVQNASLKPGSNWKDNGDGTYTTTYTATTIGNNLTATLKLNGWSGTATSPVYVITAGIPVQQTSLISVDKTSYGSGTDMAVKVTLNDAAGNAVTGQAPLLATGVQVQNANLKTGSNWKDNGDGTYAATYTANTMGTGLTATLKLSGWSGTVTSATYTITVGTPVPQASSISVDKTSYTSGADMIVNVTLKDISGNVVTGQAAQVTSGVTVQNATPKAGSNWKDNGDGTYTATYTAITVGDNLAATLQLSGWSGTDNSPVYAITPSAAVQQTSSISTDYTSYAINTDMVVKVTLKDAAGSAVSGLAAQLTTSTVDVQNATLKTGSNWQDNGDGTYTATYTANALGSSLQATLQLSGWARTANSPSYTITPPILLTGVSPNGYTFSPTAGFPTTGFTGAEFKLNLTTGGNVSNYNWQASAGWVSVTDGVVKFTGKGTNENVTITGTPKNGQGNTITYNFKLKNWFIYSSTTMPWSQADTYCSSNSGYSLPTNAQLTNGVIGTKGSAQRVLGDLFGEWGAITAYSGLPGGSNFWSSESPASGSHYFIDLSGGDILSTTDDGLPFVMCRHSL